MKFHKPALERWCKSLADVVNFQIYSLHLFTFWKEKGNIFKPLRCWCRETLFPGSQYFWWENINHGKEIDAGVICVYLSFHLMGNLREDNVYFLITMLSFIVSLFSKCISRSASDARIL